MYYSISLVTFYLLAFFVFNYYDIGHTVPSTSAVEGEHIFTSSKLVVQFVADICRKRENLIDISLPIEIDCDENISEQTILERKKGDEYPDLINEVEVEVEVEIEEDILQDEDIGIVEVPVPVNNWISQVMTMPWKELYINHLQKEGWNWFYGRGTDE